MANEEVPTVETVNVKINRSMNYYPDGTTMTHVEAGDVVEMSVKWAETFEREGWGFITHKTSAPATGGQEDGDDDSSDESGSDENGSSSDPDDDSGGEGSEDDGGDEGDEDDDEPAASPKAVELADELSVDLRSVVGTGTDGLITVDDVRGAVADQDPEV